MLKEWKDTDDSYDRSLYFSSFVSFFLGLTLATVSKTAWWTETCKPDTFSKDYKQRLVNNEKLSKNIQHPSLVSFLSL